MKKLYLGYISSFQGLSKEDIIDLDGEKILNEIGLGNSITSQRMNGFLSALNTIKQLVKQYD